MTSTEQVIQNLQTATKKSVYDSIKDIETHRQLQVQTEYRHHGIRKANNIAQKLGYEFTHCPKCTIVTPKALDRFECLYCGSRTMNFEQTVDVFIANNPAFVDKFVAGIVGANEAKITQKYKNLAKNLLGNRRYHLMIRKRLSGNR